MVTGLVALVVMAGLAFTYATVSGARQKEVRQSIEVQQAYYLAEAALNEAIETLESQGIDALKALATPQDAIDGTCEVASTVGTDEAAMDDDLVRLVATAEFDGEEQSIEAVVRMSYTSDENYVFGVFGRDYFTLDSNAHVDSYESALGTWSSQRTTKYKGTWYANMNVTVASNDNIALDSNAYVFGNATPGPGDSVSVSSNSAVMGTTIPMLEDIVLPAFDVPVITGPGGSFFRDSGSHTLSPGDYEFDSFHIDSNASIVIQGPARVLMRDYEVNSNAEVEIDASGGPVEFYVTRDFEQNSNSFIRPTSGDPSDFYLFVAGTGSTVTLSSNTEFTGVFYAPEREVEINSNVEIYGALAAAGIALDSNSVVHFDETLQSGSTSASGGGTAEIISWRPVAAD